ncbi:sodium-dependent proline transporter-like isoform X2 [Lineus longissimus]
MESELVPCRRGHWWPRCDFLFAALSLTFNVSFLSHMPWLMLQYGGGLYLIAFALVLVFVAYPLMNMEISLGQFGSGGMISVWNLCPLFKGIGYGMALMSVMSSIPYSYMSSWPLHYIASTVLTPDVLPWTTCANDWNTQNCAELKFMVQDEQQTSTASPLSVSPTAMSYGGNVNPSFSGHMQMEPAEEYYKYRFLAQIGNGTSISNVGEIQWEILLSLATFWVLMYFMLIVGHYSLGKASYFTTLVPLGIVIAFLVKVIPLPGAVDGLLYVLKITPNDVLREEFIITMTALSHISLINTFMLGYGCFTTLGSYSRLQYNYHRDSILVIIFTFLFCVLCVAMTAMYIGHYCHLLNISIGEAMKPGQKFLFIIMPSLLSSFESPRLWLCLYFALVFFLMFGTQMVVTESIVTALADEFFPVRLTKGKRMLFKSLLTLAFCLLMLLIGIPLSTQGGFDIAMLLDMNVATYSPYVLILFACLVLIWIYGIVQYSRDVKMMLGYKPDYLILGCIIGVVPLALLGCLAFTIFNKFHYRSGVNDPAWYTLVTWVIATLPLVLVPILMIIRLFQAAICPQRCGTSKNFCSRTVSPTIRWKRQYQQDVSQRQTIIQRHTASPAGRDDMPPPLYVELKETIA